MALCLHQITFSKAFVVPSTAQKAVLPHPRGCAPTATTVATTTVLSISEASKNNDSTTSSAETQTNEKAPRQPQHENNTNSPLPAVEFIDPETQCQVLLLGCSHGTESSAKDVARAVTPDTSVVALELCTSRFADLQRELLERRAQEEADGEEREGQQRLVKQPWLVAYWQMITKTVEKRGLPTGLAAAVLGGFSGVQTALSGFTPGLEFTTALEQAQEYGCDIILADQDVDETLRRMGSVPQIALGTALSDDRWDRWSLYHETLWRAVVGRQDYNPASGRPLPQVQLPLMLIRNPSAIQDLVRLTVPPTVFFWAMVYGMAALAGIDVSSNAAQQQAYYETATLAEKIPHWIASAGVLSMGYLGLVLPVVSVILTERDEILTQGIQAACRRAGKGGRVVAVLGLLHVNGVAKRMMLTAPPVLSPQPPPGRADAPPPASGSVSRRVVSSASDIEA